MENIEQPKTLEEKLNDCIQDIEGIEVDEKNATRTDAHFLETGMGPGIDTSKLTKEDGEIWYKFKNKTLGLEEFKEYKNKVANGETKNYDSHLAAMFIANQISYWEEVFEKK